MITFLPLGGGGEIGANCYYLFIDDTGIIFDCGIHPQKSGLDALPEFDLLNEKVIDHCLISHSHQDHIGSLPFLIKRFPHIQIKTTPQTRGLAELTLHNSVSILKEQAADENFEIYTHEETDLLIKSIDYKAYEESFGVTGYKRGRKINAKFFDAGHILGSASVLIETASSRIFYTGDINLSSQAWMKGAVLPDKKVDVLILESTYGATDTSSLNSWWAEAENLAKSINKILNNGGSVLIPVFALGKTQEILVTLRKLMQKKKLTEVDIYTGGLSRKINYAYDNSRYVVNTNDPDFEITKIPVHDIYDIKHERTLFKHPSIVLASSGMLIKNTMSYQLAKIFLKRKDSAIFNVGYMDESTPGFIISNAKKGDKIKLSENGKEFEVKCEIKNFRFSAHSNREELIKIVEKLKPKKVILVHGDDDAIDWMGASILKKFTGIKVYKAEIGKEIEL